MPAPDRLIAPLAASMALLGAAASLPAQAASSASSASLDGSSASVGSVSDSFQGSSNSSSKKDGKVAAGDYRIVEIADVAARPGMARLHLQAATDADDGFYLYVPRSTVAAGALADGHTVTARPRPYGVEFAHAGTAFFLMLQDDWYRELQTRPVVL